MSSKSVPQERQVRVSCQDVLQKCQVRVSHKSVKEECHPTEASRKCVKSDCPTKVSGALCNRGLSMEQYLLLSAARSSEDAEDPDDRPLALIIQRGAIAMFFWCNVGFCLPKYNARMLQETSDFLAGWM